MRSKTIFLLVSFIFVALLLSGCELLRIFRDGDDGNNSDPAASQLVYQFPQQNEASASLSTNIILRFEDANKNIDQASLTVIISGNTAVNNGQIQAGFTGSIIFDTTQALVVTLVPDIPFQVGQVVWVITELHDLTNLSTSRISYRFTCDTGGGGSTLLSVNEGRSSFTATTLDDGKVLIAGGLAASSGTPYTVASSELYDANVNAWTLIGNLNQGRISHTATKLNDGKVLVAGGWQTTNTGGIPSTEVFDPAQVTWNLKTQMNKSRWAHAAVKLNDGRVLVMGGVNNSSYEDSAEIYDPSADTWTNVANMHLERAQHTATVLLDGRVLVAGGLNDQADHINQCEIYDPTANTWTVVATMNIRRNWHAAIRFADGKVFVIGGKRNANDANTSCELYDPASNTWTNKASLWTVIGKVRAILMSNGNVLALGTRYSDKTQIYDPNTNSWSYGTNMLSYRYGPALAELNDNRILIISGSLENASPVIYLPHCEFRTP